LADLLTFQMRYDLPITLAKVLVLLADNIVVTAAMIEDEHGLTKNAKVVMHRLRRCLDGTGIEIKSRRDIGYWLTSEGKQVLANEPLGHGDSLPAV